MKNKSKKFWKMLKSLKSPQSWGLSEFLQASCVYLRTTVQVVKTDFSFCISVLIPVQLH